MARLRTPVLAALLFLALTGVGPAPAALSVSGPLSRPADGGPLPRPGDAITGTARVTDGDTLRIAGTRIRLLGVDAPESRQLCPDASGKSWPCGQVAARKLEALVAGRTVRCMPENLDRYGRTVASCSVDGQDLGEVLVREGLARAYARYSDRYVATEAAAMGRHRGLWEGDAEAPWDWRRDKGAATAAAERDPKPADTADARGPKPAATADAGEAGCRIKGNISGDGRKLYHTPGMATWSRTRIDPARGERYFCDEASAQASGWLPASGGKTQP